MLVPVAFVITVILAAFAMNSALTFLAHQELSRAASAGANDIASAIARESVYDGANYEVGVAAAQSMLKQNMLRRVRDSVLEVEVKEAVIDGDTVTVTASGLPRIATWRILPWTNHRITATAQASAVRR